MEKRFYVIFYLLIASNVTAQQNINSGLLPKLNLSTKINNKLKLVSSVESRQLLIENKSFSPNYVLTDLTNVVGLKLSNRNSLNLGYTLRLRDKEMIHRIIQQYNSIQSLNIGRIGHRIGIDQTFSKQSEFTLRSRYRITLEKPLQGTQIDPKEFYLKIGNEYLGALTDNLLSFEIRLTPNIGYEINDLNKIEMGLDYRLSEFRNQNFWLSLVWFSSLKQ